MAHATPLIEYTAPLHLANSWWQVLQRAGLTVRFYADSYGSPSTLCPPQLVDEPTAFGGWVYEHGRVLAVVAWDWKSATDTHVNCLVGSNPPLGDSVHWAMIGSGARAPRVPLNDVKEGFLIECLGGFRRLYTADERVWQEWTAFLFRGTYAVEQCRSLPVLPPPHFAHTVSLGRRWWRVETIEFCTGPSVAAFRAELELFAVVRTWILSATIDRALQDLEIAILRAGARAVTVDVQEAASR